MTLQVKKLQFKGRQDWTNDDLRTTVNSIIETAGTGAGNPEPGPPGEAGVSPTIAVIDTLTAEPTDPARVVNTGTQTDVKLQFVIPKGASGVKGDKGDRPDLGFDGGSASSRYLPDQNITGGAATSIYFTGQYLNGGNASG